MLQCDEPIYTNIPFSLQNWEFSGQLFRPFGKSDPRLNVALGTHEALIHFALVCGAKSCPPIKTYSVKVNSPSIYLFLVRLDCQASVTNYSSFYVNIKLFDIFRVSISWKR